MVIESFAVGYLSGSNAWAPVDRPDPLANIPIEFVTAWIDNYCR